MCMGDDSAAVWGHVEVCLRRVRMWVVPVS